MILDEEHIGITVLIGYHDIPGVSTVLSSTTPSTLLGRDFMYSLNHFLGVGMTSLLVLHAEFYIHAQITKTQFWASKYVPSIPGRIDCSAQIYGIQSINSNIELNCPH